MTSQKQQNNPVTFFLFCFLPKNKMKKKKKKMKKKQTKKHKF